MATKAERREARKASKKTTSPAPAPAPRPPLKPLTEKQADYIEALATHQLVVSTGPAGTGKTYVAAAYAADLMLEGEIDRIIITRPMVPVEEEEVGHLPGTLTEKTAVWSAPVYEALCDRLGAARVDVLAREKKIVFVPLAFMQGLSFRRDFVLFDEAQNSTPTQMKMFLTRIGRDTRAAVDGDLKQRVRRDERPSGLYVLKDVIPSLQKYAIEIEFTNSDIVRSGLCRVAAEAFERKGY